MKIVFQDLDIGKENPSKIFCNQIKKIILKYKQRENNSNLNFYHKTDFNFATPGVGEYNVAKVGLTVRKKSPEATFGFAPRF